MAFLKYSVLALRILVWATLASFIVFAIVTAFGVGHERSKALKAAHGEVEMAVTRTMPAISVSLWQYDKDGLQALLNGLAEVPTLAKVEVLDHDKVLATAGHARADQPADRIWTATVQSPDGRQEIGVIRLSESYASLNARISETVRTLVASELVKIIGLAFILLVIVYRKVARHIQHLAVEVSQLRDIGQIPQLTLNRRKFGGYRDELDILVEAINRFVADRAHESARRSAAEGSLRERVSEIEATMGALSDGVIALDAGCRIRYANRAACSLLHRSEADMVGRDIRQELGLLDENRQPMEVDFYGKVIVGNEAFHLRGGVSIRTAAGRSFEARISAVPVPDSADVSMIFVFTDISEEIQKERKIEFQAYHDPLTRLGNRSLLARNLPREIEQAQSDSRCLAVLCLDLDNFKNINDTLGHMIGDVMLRQLAGRFRETVGAPGWVTRHGGDEFIVVLPGLESSGEAIAVAEQLMRRIAEPFSIEDHDLRITSSIGISLCPAHGVAMGQLISNADLAMYDAKQQGKNAWKIYDERMSQRSAERLQMENRLRVAIAEKQFSLAFQPQVDLANGRVESVEALLRWHCPEAGWIPPGIFIPVAEEAGLINEIGDWVLRESLNAARRMRATLGRKLAVAVNVSPLQFRSESLLETLRELAGEAPDLPDLIEIELTETALSGEIDEIARKLAAIKGLGLKVAIDDFGTGYSSLAYLKTFPIDILKIDQAFIRDLPNSAKDEAIVASVIQLGNNLGFRVIAEGVEEAEHARILRGLGCDMAQGYWYARPVPESELANKIRLLMVQ